MSAIGRTDEKGFTLLEMLVVMAVTALIAGLSFPALMKIIEQQNFRRDAARLEAELHTVRARAIALDETVRFRPASTGLGEALLDLPARGLFFFADGSSNGGSLSFTAGKKQARFAVEPATGVIRRLD